jgi:hypothetical protein
MKEPASSGAEPEAAPWRRRQQGLRIMDMLAACGTGRRLRPRHMVRVLVGTSDVSSRICTGDWLISDSIVPPIVPN